MSLMIKSARMAAGTVHNGRGPTGDPGLFGFLKGVAKTAGSFLTGGPVAAVSTAANLITGRRATPRVPTGSIGFAQQGPGQRVVPAPGPRAAIQRALPFGQTGLMVERNGAVGTKLACPGGFHPNKASYFLRDGTFVPEGSRCVKNRRRNPMNPRALRRAVSRVEMGKKWQGKLREIETGRYTKAGNRKD